AGQESLETAGWLGSADCRGKRRPAVSVRGQYRQTLLSAGRARGGTKVPSGSCPKMRSMGKPINITCAGRENLQAWLALQQETTERVHPSWFPGIDTDLIVHARRLSTGRRWLANRLAQVSPLLFGMPQETETMPARKLREAQWLRTCLHDALECALDLGSLTLASTLRTLVTRSEVMRLRTVVGAERYERLLSAPPAALSLSEPPGLGIRVWWGADLRENDLLERL